MRQMNRVLVGTMLEVANGRRTLESFVRLLDGPAARGGGPDRAAARAVSGRCAVLNRSWQISSVGAMDRRQMLARAADTLAAWNRGDPEGIAVNLAEDVIWRDVALGMPLHGREALEGGRPGLHDGASRTCTSRRRPRPWRRRAWSRSSRSRARISASSSASRRPAA